ncbi:MAG: aminopeptidase N [Bdellovibrionales bacterium]|nr:aminopeptidase N [Bdellovibrionales bacterium]
MEILIDKKYFSVFKALACLTVLSVSACSKNMQVNKESVSRSDKPELSQFYAKYRSTYVSDVEYDLFFSLDQETFEGNSLISFTLHTIPEHLSIDFTDGTVKKILVNGEASKGVTHQHYIDLVASQLQVGKNVVEISYNSTYSIDGSGLYHFKDSEDGRDYVYSDFEPYYANRVFPCFDQPDLKAHYKVQVEAPKTWKVITSVREDKVSNLKGGKKRWNFPKSKKFSTYIFSLHAGEYEEIALKVPQIPSRLFVRKSLAKYVDVKNWETYTKQGFSFFQEYFDYPYPFDKYDQLMVPDFNWGGMENTAAITYSENFVKKGVKTREERMHMADVVLHEMAHMWFGNLVTMKWWDDLWLNESFATYAAYLAAEKATEFTDAWDTFSQADKTWAYQSDAQVSTHPIATVVENTDVAFSNFDGITYGKGSASLQQLSYLIGDKAFKNGVQSYFKNYAYQNTTLKDFVDELDRASTLDLSEWIPQWIQTQGTNIVQSEYACKNGKISHFALIQKGQKGTKQSRQHRMELSLLDENLEIYHKIETTYDRKKNEINELEGKSCPSFVFLNSNDKDFVQVSLSENEVDFISTKISSLKKKLQRFLVWNQLWRMASNAELSVYKYAEIVRENLPMEENLLVISPVIETVFGYWRNPENSLALLIPEETDLQKRTKHEILNQLAEIFLSKSKREKAGSDHQTTWFNAFLQTSNAPKHMEVLEKILLGEPIIKGLETGQDLRWEIIQKLNASGQEKYYSLVEKELKKDQSENGKKAAITCQAIRPRKENKLEWLEKVASQEELHSSALQKAAIQFILPVSQLSLRPLLEDKVYETMDRVSQTEQSDVAMETLTSYALPLVCEKGSTKKLHNFLEKHEDISERSKNNILNLQQAYEKCAQVKELAILDFEKRINHLN